MSSERPIPDIETLAARVALLESLLEQRDATLAMREAQLVEAVSSNEKLARQLEALKHRLHGRRNERFTLDPSQLVLFAATGEPIPPVPDEAPDPAPEAEAASPSAVLPERRKRGQNIQRHKHGRGKLPDTLPRRRIHCTHPEGATCPRCKGALAVIGQDVTERLEWVPGHFEVLEIATDKAACPACPGAGVQAAIGPSFALPRALCANGLLAKVLCDKFADHIPLHRQARRFAREGLDLSVSTLCGWTLRGAELLKVIVEAMMKAIRAGCWAQADDTGFPIQDGTDGQLRSARLWTYANGEHVVFRVTSTKKGDGPAEHLADFKGRLLLDGGSEFNLIADALGVERAGCWSHARRYFFDARTTDPIGAGEALILIRDIFLIEREIVDATPERRHAVRQERTRPAVERFRQWLESQRGRLRPGSDLARGVKYATNQWKRLTMFLDHPELPIHNNTAEFQLRQPVVGRKNWLFAGSEGGAQAAAVIYSLVGSCILQAIDPWAYLLDVLDRLPDWPANRVIELSPARWREARLAELRGELAPT